MSLFILALIIALMFVIFGGYFGWFGTPWTGPYYGGGLGLIVVVLSLLLATGTVSLGFR